MTDYEDELLSFPRGKHDDQVDTASMAGEIVHSFVSELKPWSATPEHKPHKSPLDSDFDDFANIGAPSAWS